MNKCCPKCKGRIFSVSISGCKKYNSKLNIMFKSISEVEIIDGMYLPYCCDTCGEEYSSIKDLKKI